MSYIKPSLPRTFEVQTTLPNRLLVPMATHTAHAVFVGVTATIDTPRWNNVRAVRSAHGRDRDALTKDLLKSARRRFTDEAKSRAR